MADFDYVAIDPRGNEARGHVAATDMDAARAALDRRRLYVVRIEPGSAPAARGRGVEPAALSGTRRRVST